MTLKSLHSRHKARNTSINPHLQQENIPQTRIKWTFAGKNKHTFSPSYEYIHTTQIGVYSASIKPGKEKRQSMKLSMTVFSYSLFHFYYSQISPETQQNQGFQALSSKLLSFAAWSAAIQASTISWISPSITLSSLYKVRLILWSVTRPWGKL